MGGEHSAETRFIGLHVPELLAAALRARAGREGLTLSELVRRQLAAQLEQDAQRARRLQRPHRVRRRGERNG